MELGRFYLILKIFLGFIVVLVVEYLGCGVYFRLIRDPDFVRLDWSCVLLAPGLCYLIFRKLIKNALQERIPVTFIVLYFLFFTLLLGFFLRFSLQLANGFLDRSDPETHVVFVTGQKISAFGGSIVEDGINPMAYMVYFHGWEENGENCEMRVNLDTYYSIVAGSRLELSVRRGFFHWPWVEAYQLVYRRG